MADKPGSDEKSFVLSVMDRLWIRKSLELQRTSLERSKGKEMAMSPVLEMRDREIAAINSVLAKLG